jgi:hypothetical protein
MVQADGIPEETDGSVTTRLESFELRRVINAHSFDNAGCIPDFHSGAVRVSNCRRDLRRVSGQRQVARPHTPRRPDGDRQG